jgi:predicted acetyltransferase
MDIHLTVKDDVEQVRQLWEYCFDDSKQFVDFFFEHRFYSGNTIAVYDGGKICSCLQILPYKIMLRGKIYNCSYIVGVSTWPEYRGKGYAGRLLRAALDELIVRKHPVSILLPFRYDFYRKYGWETCYDQILYDDITTGFMNVVKEDCYFKPVVVSDDIYELQNCYIKFMSSYNGYIYREKEDWLRLLKELNLSKGAAYILKSGNKCEGYIIYTIRSKTLHIHECIYVNREAREGLIAFATSHYGGQVEKVSMIAPQDDLTYLSMADPRGLLQKKPYVMARINDVDVVLSDLPATNQLNIVLNISDDLLEKNNGCFKIETHNGKTIASRTDLAPDGKLSIGALTQLFWGYLTPEQAIRNGLIQAYNRNVVNNLNKLFPRITPYIIEDY